MLDLDLLPEEYAVCRLPAGSALPASLSQRSGRQERHLGDLGAGRAVDHLPGRPGAAEATAETAWRCLRVVGPLDLALTGVLASLVGPLADARVNIVTFSTYDTDYLLVPAVRLAEAVDTLTAAGHRIAS